MIVATDLRSVGHFHESENRFFMRIVVAQGVFLRDANGRVDRLLWHQGGKYQYCLGAP
jgi:hypothetical protein